jgi:hypothetical protein
MKCRDFEKSARALASDQLIDAERRALSLAHSEVCPRCCNRLIEERALIDGVRAVVQELGQERPSARLEASLMTAFREEVTATNSPVITPFRIKTRRWRPFVLQAAAAVVLITISATAVFWLRSGLLNDTYEAGVMPAMTIDPLTAGTFAPDGVPEMEDAPKISAPRRRAHNRPVRQYEKATEQVTDYYPLSDGVDLNSLEAVQVVRIELPASALRQYGLPGGANMGSQAVTADVVLGYDGLARAIRFVH